jgi:hypothetical protein
MVLIGRETQQICIRYSRILCGCMDRLQGNYYSMGGVWFEWARSKRREL